MRIFHYSILFFIAASCTMISATLYAQDTAIVRTFGGLYFEEGRQIIECANGGYLIVGTTGSDQNLNTNLYVIRLDNDMNCLWNHSYGTNTTDWGFGVMEDEEGNFLASGYTGDSDGYDALLIKLSADGDLIWQHEYGGEDWDFAYSIYPHPISGYLIAGKTYSLGNGSSDGYLLHVNDDGEVIHEYTYGGIGDDTFTSVIAVNEELVVVGGQYENDNGLLTGWCQALDENFTVVWTKLFDEYPNSIVRDLKVADNDNFLICGSYGDSVEELKFGFYRKMSANGNVVWQQSSNEYTVESIAQNEEHVYVVGKTGLFGLGGLAAMILRLDFWSSWQSGAAFGEVYDEIPNDIIVDSDNAVIMIGSSNSYSPNQYMDVYAVKFEDPEIVSSYVLEIEHQDCFTVNVEETLSLDKPIFTQRKGAIKVTWMSEKFHLSVSDIAGRIVYEEQNFVNGSEIQYQDWPTSVFIVTLNDGDDRVNYRFVSDH